MRRILRRLFGLPGHVRPVPEERARLMVLTDYLWSDYIGGRAWCDAKRRPCRVCYGKCCPCAHTERHRGDV